MSGGGDTRRAGSCRSGPKRATRVDDTFPVSMLTLSDGGLHRGICGNRKRLLLTLESAGFRHTFCGMGTYDFKFGTE